MGNFNHLRASIFFLFEVRGDECDIIYYLKNCFGKPRKQLKTFQKHNNKSVKAQLIFFFVTVTRFTVLKLICVLFFFFGGIFMAHVHDLCHMLRYI